MESAVSGAAAVVDFDACDPGLSVVSANCICGRTGSGRYGSVSGIRSVERALPGVESRDDSGDACCERRCDAHTVFAAERGRTLTKAVEGQTVVCNRCASGARRCGMSAAKWRAEPDRTDLCAASGVWTDGRGAVCGTAVAGDRDNGGVSTDCGGTFVPGHLPEQTALAVFSEAGSAGGGNFIRRLSRKFAAGCVCMCAGNPYWMEL